LKHPHSCIMSFARAALVFVVQLAVGDVEVNPFAASAVVTELSLARCAATRCGSRLSGAEADLGRSLFNSSCFEAIYECGVDAYTCYKDSTCHNAVQCAWGLAQRCGGSMWNATQDPDIRDDLQCVLTCGNDLRCVMSECGAKAAPCLMDTNSTCHEALFCLRDGGEQCSTDSFQCLMGSSENDACNRPKQCLHKLRELQCLPALSASPRDIDTFARCVHKQCESFTTKVLV